MPIIQVNWLQGHSADVKRKYSAELTKTTCECLGIAPEVVRIIFNDMPHDNYAAGGILFSDKK